MEFTIPNVLEHVLESLPDLAVLLEDDAYSAYFRDIRTAVPELDTVSRAMPDTIGTLNHDLLRKLDEWLQAGPWGALPEASARIKELIAEDIAATAPVAAQVAAGRVEQYMHDVKTLRATFDRVADATPEQIKLGRDTVLRLVSDQVRQEPTLLQNVLFADAALLLFGEEAPAYTRRLGVKAPSTIRGAAREHIVEMGERFVVALASGAGWPTALLLQGVVNGVDGPLSSSTFTVTVPAAAQTPCVRPAAATAAARLGDKMDAGNERELLVTRLAVSRATAVADFAAKLVGAGDMDLMRDLALVYLAREQPRNAEYTAFLDRVISAVDEETLAEVAAMLGVSIGADVGGSPDDNPFFPFFLQLFQAGVSYAALLALGVMGLASGAVLPGSRMMRFFILVQIAYFAVTSSTNDLNTDKDFSARRQLNAVVAVHAGVHHMLSTLATIYAFEGVLDLVGLVRTRKPSEYAPGKLFAAAAAPLRLPYIAVGGGFATLATALSVGLTGSSDGWLAWFSSAIADIFQTGAETLFNTSMNNLPIVLWAVAGLAFAATYVKASLFQRKLRLALAGGRREMAAVGIAVGSALLRMFWWSQTVDITGSKKSFSLIEMMDAVNLYEGAFVENLGDYLTNYVKVWRYVAQLPVAGADAHPVAATIALGLVGAVAYSRLFPAAADDDGGEGSSDGTRGRHAEVENSVIRMLTGVLEGDVSAEEWGVEVRATIGYFTARVGDSVVSITNIFADSDDDDEEFVPEDTPEPEPYERRTPAPDSDDESVSALVFTSAYYAAARPPTGTVLHPRLDR